MARPVVLAAAPISRYAGDGRRGAASAGGPPSVITGS